MNIAFSHHPKRIVGFVLVIMLLSIGITTAQETNLVDSCVTDYDPDVNYFPDQVEITHATGFEVEYHNSYKVVTVTRPWLGATEADAFQYVLVQCGTPVPEGYDDAQIIELPVNTVISMSTTHLPHLTALGVLDRVIGLDSFLYVNTPQVRDLINGGGLVEVGSGSAVNVELVLDSNPDVVMGYGTGVPDWDAHPILLEAGIPVAMNSEHAEVTPLGRAEWIKFTALFFNVEAAANAVFDTIVTEYESAAALVRAIPADERPSVLINSFSPFDEAWTIPGAETYVGQLFNDAGARLVLGETAPDISVQYDFETVYDAGLDADYWFAIQFGINTIDDLIAQDERYADFAAVQNGRVYNDNARVNENGGNDWYENGVTNPHVLLRDIIHILYPDLLPDHELVFYHPLVTAGE